MKDWGSPVWGGTTLGLIIGIVVGAVTGDWCVAIIGGVVIGAAVGLGADLLGRLSDYLRNHT